MSDSCIPHNPNDLGIPTRVTASAETLMRQAGYTAEAYLKDAVTHIDGQFGKGFAQKHPELIGHFMLTAALDFHAASVQIASQNVQEALTDEVHRTDHPLFGETLSDGIRDGVSGIADALAEPAFMREAAGE